MAYSALRPNSISSVSHDILEFFLLHKFDLKKSTVFLFSASHFSNASFISFRSLFSPIFHKPFQIYTVFSHRLVWLRKCHLFPKFKSGIFTWFSSPCSTFMTLTLIQIQRNVAQERQGRKKIL